MPKSGTEDCLRVLVVTRCWLSGELLSLCLRMLLEVDATLATTGFAEAADEIARLRPHLALLQLCPRELRSVAWLTRSAKRRRWKTRLLGIAASCPEKKCDSTSLPRFLPVVSPGAGLRGLIRAMGVALLPGEAHGRLHRPAHRAGPLSLAADGGSAREPRRVLTARQQHILKLVSEGLTSEQIAQMLELSRRTVEGHRSNIMRRLGVKSVAESVLEGLRRGLID